ncbi:MAG: glycosyltransferase family 2 protein [bacterium]
MISIIIINWNGEKFLQACLESVSTQSYGPIEIVLVDNASKDNSLVNLPREVVLIKNEVNKGFCAAANQGIKRSKGEFIVLLNHDVTLDKSFIKNIVETFLIAETVGMVSGKILRMDGKIIDSAGQFMNCWAKPVERGYNQPDHGQFEEKMESFSVCGAVACYRRKMLEDVKIPLNPPFTKGETENNSHFTKGEIQLGVGGFEYFDEDFFAFYEDLDLGWRARLRGWKALYNPKAVAYHYRGGTQTKNHRFQILGRPKDIQLKIIFNRYLTIIKNVSKIHFLLYFPFFFARSIIDLFFIIFYIPDSPHIFNEIKLFKSAWEKRVIIQARRLTQDKVIRKFIS